MEFSLALVTRCGEKRMVEMVLFCDWFLSLGACLSFLIDSVHVVDRLCNVRWRQGHTDYE